MIRCLVLINRSPSGNLPPSARKQQAALFNVNTESPFDATAQDIAPEGARFMRVFDSLQ
jgi:hypothetical protein